MAQWASKMRELLAQRTLAGQAENSYFFLTLEVQMKITTSIIIKIIPPHCTIFGVVLQEILFQPAVLCFNKILGLWLFNNDIWVILMSYNFNFF